MGNHDAASARARTGAASYSGTTRNASRPAQQLTKLSNWPVSRRLFAVIALALVMGLVFGGLEVASAQSSATQFGRVLQLAKLGQQDVILVHDLQNERDTTLGLVSKGSTASLTTLHDVTNAEATKVLALAAGIDGSYPANIQASVASLQSQLGTSLVNLQNSVQTEFWDQTTPGTVVDGQSVLLQYAPLINTLITLNDELAQGTSDAALAIDVREMNLLSLAKDQSSQQRGLFYNAFTQQSFSDREGQALISAISAEGSAEDAFKAAATPAAQKALNAVLNGAGAKQVARVEEFFFHDGNDQQAHPFLSPNISVPTVGFTVAQAPKAWYTAASQKLDDMQSIELGVAQDAVARAQSLQHGAGESALLILISVVVVLLIVLIAALLVARSLAVPLRRLRAAALDIATSQLPERMRRLSDTPDAVADLQVAPIDVLTSDEIGQVARAFDQVHAEAVRLAGNEAVLRTSLNAMFVNLSRRSQTLIERVARTVDSLEQDEDNPDRLSSLFSIDHMVTRMRRNSENLLLLAGHEGARKWSDPVSVADVARAATSEIEHYSRVVLNIQPGVAVIGTAVSDIVHLLAELIENATLYSPSDTTVRVSGHELPSGGVLVEITDKGIGIPEERLAEVNWRLQSTPAIDVSVSRHMGLFAVARLAERHGVQVRLRPANPQGLSVLVWLPDTVIEHTALPFPGRRMAQGTGGVSTLAKRTPGQNGITRAGADGQSETGSMVSTGPQRVEWFRRRDSAPTSTPAVAPAVAPGGAGRGDQPSSSGLPVRVPGANPLHGPAGGGQAADTD